MKKNLFCVIKLFLAVFVTIFFCCCTDPADNTEPKEDIKNLQGLYILCEGTFGQNNSALDWYDTQKDVYTKDLFSSVNNQGLGQTANDAVKVGNDIFIAVMKSACVFVIDANTCKIKQMIPILNSSGVNRQPSHLVYKDGYVYLSCFDGYLVKISAENYKIEATLNTMGNSSEELVAVKNDLYIANSGGLSYPNVDSVVVVVNLATFTVKDRIIVAPNPIQIKSDGEDIYVLSWQNPYSSEHVLTKINNNTVADTLQTTMTKFTIANKTLYYHNYDYATDKFELRCMDLEDIHSSDRIFSTQTKDMKIPYAIDVIDDKIYVSDSKNSAVSGELFIYDREGNLLKKHSTSICPRKILKK